MSDSQQPLHLLPPLEGAELEDAILEAIERLDACQAVHEEVERRGLSVGQRLIRGAERERLIRLARRGKFREGMLDYYPGIPHNVTPSVRRAIRRGYGARLVVTATRNGVHSATSLHRFGRAANLGNVVAHVGPDATGRRRLVAYQLAEFRAWRTGDRPHLQELIGPDNNAVVLRGRWSPLPDGSPLENQHDNHVHEGFFS